MKKTELKKQGYAYKIENGLELTIKDYKRIYLNLGFKTCLEEIVKRMETYEKSELLLRVVFYGMIDDEHVKDKPSLVDPELMKSDNVEYKFQDKVYNCFMKFKLKQKEL